MTTLDHAPAQRNTGEPEPGIVANLIDGLRLVADRESLHGLTFRQCLEALGVAVYTTDADGRITFYNDAAAEFWGRRPDLGELWCGSWKMFWPDGRPLPHDECPMAIALRQGRSVRGYEAVAERPDGSRAAFVPYPTVVRDGDGAILGAMNVIIDVTDRKRAERALQAASVVKDEFLGMISHELRTPVTTIFGNARLLQGRADLPPIPAAMVADIASDAERLLGIVENLLLLTRTDAADVHEAEPQVLAHVAGRIIDSFRRYHPGRRIEWRVESRQLVVHADHAHLELLVVNLLSNADKYSPESEPIEVIAREAGSEAQLIVLDRGIGFAPEEADQLFTTFFRSAAAKKAGSGLGIGLSASRRIAELLGGRIWATPREGGGSEFGFALPASPDTED